MYNHALILAFLISLLSLVGCTQQAETPKQAAVCNPPYILVGTSCCLDQNSNSICDSDEAANDSGKIVCNQPYLLVGTECCLDQNANSVCDSDEGEKKGSGDTKLSQELLVERVRDAVVTLKVKSPYEYESYHGEIILRDGESTSSGFFASEDGQIITTAHSVIDYVAYCTIPSNRICEFEATTFNGNTYDVEWLSLSTEWDMAVLKIKNEKRKFSYINISDESGKIGDKIFVVGAPYGLEFSFSSGIISQKDRESLMMEGDEHYSKYLQTDAAVNEGNSGGPIVNENGEVVAMASFGYLLTEGLNFGLQAEEIRRLYLKTFDDTQRVLIKTSYLEEHGADSYSGKVKIKKLTETKLYTQEGKLIFKSFTMGVDNTKNSSINLCFDVKLVSLLGIINYDGKFDSGKVINANSDASISYTPDIKLETDDYLHFYVVEPYDCNTLEVYDRTYGPGAVIPG